MSFQITGNKPVDRAIIPGGILGLLVAGVAINYGNFTSSLPSLNLLFGLLALVVIACLGYYYFELRNQASFVAKANRLCMFLASFSFFFNCLIVLVPSYFAVFNWPDIILPAIIIVACYFLETRGEFAAGRKAVSEKSAGAKSAARKKRKAAGRKKGKSRKG